MTLPVQPPPGRGLGALKSIGRHTLDSAWMEPQLKIGFTRLELNGLRLPAEVIGIQELNDEGNLATDRPGRITNILQECGAPVKMEDGDYRFNVTEDLLELLQKPTRA